MGILPKYNILGGEKDMKLMGEEDVLQDIMLEAYKVNRYTNHTVFLYFARTHKSNRFESIYKRMERKCKCRYFKNGVFKQKQFIRTTRRIIRHSI